MQWLLTPAGAATSACWYWSTCSLNPLADAWDIAGITQRINGGMTGAEERLTLSTKALAAIVRRIQSARPQPPPEPAATESSADALNDAELAQINGGG